MNFEEEIRKCLSSYVGVPALGELEKQVKLDVESLLRTTPKKLECVVCKSSELEVDVKMKGEMLNITVICQKCK